MRLVVRCLKIASDGKYDHLLRFVFEYTSLLEISNLYSSPNAVVRCSLKSLATKHTNYFYVALTANQSFENIRVFHAVFPPSVVTFTATEI
jgi:hypothetical protein